MGPSTDVESRKSEAPLAELIAQHSDVVYRLAYSVVRDPGLSDDVTQETFIKVWKHAGEFRGEGSMRGWILRIAHREAIAALRRRRDAPTDPHTFDHPTDPIATGRVVEGRLAVAGLAAALDDLDELSRAILVLRELEGLSYHEIAETTEVPVATVKTRLLRGRRSMAIALEGWRP